MESCEGSPVLLDYPNSNNNSFVMMRFRETKPHVAILASLRDALSYYGRNGLRADEKNYSEYLWTNVKYYMDACATGVVVFEQIDDEDFNPNVSLELGYMIAQKKPVLLLKEKRLSVLPTDVVGNLYRSFDSYDISTTIRSSMFQWLRDIGVAKSSAERDVLFVSYGGTCRCAMAKVALDQALLRRQLPYRLRVISVAQQYGGTHVASRGARRAVFESYGSDLLETHRVTRQNPGLLGDADLILAMEGKLCEGLPPEKTFCFNDFFGLQGDVPNPWPDDEDEAAYKRYRDCMCQMRLSLDNCADKILTFLE